MRAPRPHAARRGAQGAIRNGRPEIDTYRLRPATPADTLDLLQLFSQPPVCEFLSDGVPPPIAILEEWVSAAVDHSGPMGLWLLENLGAGPLGCVRLAPVPEDAAAAELIYALDPGEWGRGLAIAMSRSVIARAFEFSSCESIVAGADLANTRSVAVMRRLGMVHHRDVEYPLGPGVEYRLTRSQLGDWGAEQLIRFGP